ncbi:hypothetical protein JCM11491_005402 [Sporobolomyces phaffii]
MNGSKHILPKGSSCSTCKARKVKCDAQKPACGACVRSARFKHQDPTEISCCYGTPRRRSEKGVRGVGGSSPKKDIEGAMERLGTNETFDAVPSSTSVVDENVYLDGIPYAPPTHSLFEPVSLPAPPPSQFPLPLQPTSLDTLYKLPFLSSDLPSLRNSTLYKPEAFPPFDPQLWPSKLALTHGSEFDPSDFNSTPSPTSTHSSVSSDRAGSFSSFDSYDSLDLNPFGLTDDFPFYDSSAAPSPPSTSSRFDAPIDGTPDSLFYPPESDFASLSLPVFPLPLGW